MGDQTRDTGILVKMYGAAVIIARQAMNRFGMNMVFMIAFMIQAYCCIVNCILTMFGFSVVFIMCRLMLVPQILGRQRPQIDTEQNKS